MGIEKVSRKVVMTYQEAVYVGQYNCGIAEIQYGNHKFGYINMLGDKAFDYDYESTGKFNNGFAVVKEFDLGFAIIDMNGNVRARNLLYSTSINFGSCIVVDGSEYFIFNGIGKRKIEMAVDRADGDGFLRGFAIIEGAMDGKMALIHISGERVPTLTNDRGITLEILRPVDGRYATVEEYNGETTVYLWRLGRNSPEKAFPGYGSVIVYPNGFIAMSRGGRWGIYLDSGAEVFSPQFYWMTECEVPGVFPYGDIHAMKGFITMARGKNSNPEFIIETNQYTSFEYIGGNVFICYGDAAPDPIVREF